MHTHSSQLVSLSLPRAMRLLLAAFFCMLFAGVAQAQDFTVSGTSGRNWVDTGLDIAPGTLLQLSATGTVDVDLVGVPGGRKARGDSQTYQAIQRRHSFAMGW